MGAQWRRDERLTDFRLQRFHLRWKRSVSLRYRKYVVTDGIVDFMSKNP